MDKEIEKGLNFFRAFGKIEWNMASIVICAMPLSLVFIGLNLVIFVFDEEAGSVVSNDEKCAIIGKNILKDGGSVVDAAIATMLCEGVVLPNRAGLGGGFTAVMFVAGTVETLTATPTVPANFKSGYLTGNIDEVEGAKAGGVPGELMGYWEMHKKYGLLPWKELVEPTIKLCEEGVPITEWLELDMQRHNLYEKKGMHQLYLTLLENSDGHTFKFLTLAKTLRRIANEGPQIFYHGDLGKSFIEDIRARGSVMTMKDLNNYNVSWSDRPVIFSLPGRRRAYTTGLPSMGAVVALVMNIVKSLPDKGSPLFWHRTIEAMKHAYGLSYTLADVQYESDDNVAKTVLETYRNMIDLDYAIEMRKKIKKNQIWQNFRDYGVRFRPVKLAGSSNICIISPAGQAIVMTSSLMWDFGTFAWSSSTGIILNNQIRSFTSDNAIIELPQSYAAYVYPGKRAISPHAPTIVVDRQRAQVHFTVGAAGSALIPSQVITALLNYCILRTNAFMAANSGFFHPDALSNVVLLSDPIGGVENYNDEILEYLKEAGHNITLGYNENPYAIRTLIAHSHTKPDIQFTYHEQGGAAAVEPAHGFNTFFTIVAVSQALWIISVMIYEIVIYENSKGKEDTSSQ